VASHLYPNFLLVLFPFPFVFKLALLKEFIALTSAFLEDWQDMVAYKAFP